LAEPDKSRDRRGLGNGLQPATDIMDLEESILVYGSTGPVGTIDRSEWAQRGHAERIYLTLTNGQRVLLRPDLLTEQNGAAYLSHDLASAHDVATPSVSNASAVTASDAAVARASRIEEGRTQLAADLAEDVIATPVHARRAEAVVPVVEEEAVVGKQVVQNKVQVRKTTHTREEVADVPLMRQTVEVERVPINRVIDTPVDIRQEGDTVIVPVMEEVLVIEKRLMLKEEVRLITRRTEFHDPQPVTLRYEQVDIQRQPPVTATAQEYQRQHAQAAAARGQATT
jgi:uncharacterized protein (TIGR02271 family)